MRFSIKNRNGGVSLSGLSPRLTKKSFKWVAVLAVALLPFLSLAAGEKKGGMSAGMNIRDVFANLHTPGLETVRKSARLDLTDYWEADSVHKVVTIAGGAAWLEALTADYLRVRVSPVSVVELRILPVGTKKIVGCVYTVGDSVQAKDSEINFYDSSLRPLDKKKYFKTPELEEFFNIPKGEESIFKEIREEVPFPTVAYSFSPDNTTLTARLTVEDYVSPDCLPLLRKYMQKDLTAKWKGKYKF